MAGPWNLSDDVVHTLLVDTHGTHVDEFGYTVDVGRKANPKAKTDPRSKAFLTDPRLKGKQRPKPIEYRTRSPVLSAIGSFFRIIALFFLFLLWGVFTVIINLHIVIVILGVFFILFFVRRIHGDVVIFVQDIYLIFAILGNYFIDNFNHWLEVFRPFIPAYNLYQWFNRIWSEIFWRVVDPELMVELILIMVDVVWEIMPTVILLMQKLLPVFFELIPFIAYVVSQVFEFFFDVVVDLLELAVSFITAILPLLPTLILIFSRLVTIAIVQFSGILLELVKLFQFVLSIVLPFLRELINEFIAIINTVTTELDANGGDPDPSGESGGIGQIFKFLFLLFTASIEFIIKITIKFMVAIINLVTSNLPRIVAFVTYLIQLMVRILPPIVVLLIELATTSFPVLMSLVTVIGQAFIDLVDPIYDSLQAMIASGVFERLIGALLAGFATPNSPTFMTTFTAKLGDVLRGSVPLITAFIVESVKVLIILFPLAIDIVNLVLASGILASFLKAVLEFMIALIPLYVTIFKVVILEVFFKILLQRLIELFVDFIGEFAQYAVNLFATLATQVVVPLFLACFEVIVDLAPIIIRLLIDIALNSVTVITVWFIAAASALAQILSDPDFFPFFYDLYFTIVSLPFVIIFGVDVSKIQDIFTAAIELYFRFWMAILEPFLGLGFADSINPETASPAQILNALTVAWGYVEGFLTDIFNAISGAIALLNRVNALQSAFQFLYDLIKVPFEFAAKLFYEIIEPVICPINAACCYILLDFGCCILPGFCDCWYVSRVFVLTNTHTLTPTTFHPTLQLQVSGLLEIQYFATHPLLTPHPTQQRCRRMSRSSQ